MTVNLGAPWWMGVCCSTVEWRLLRPQEGRGGGQTQAWTCQSECHVSRNAFVFLEVRGIAELRKLDQWSFRHYPNKLSFSRKQMSKVFFWFFPPLMFLLEIGDFYLLASPAWEQSYTMRVTYVLCVPFSQRNRTTLPQRPCFFGLIAFIKGVCDWMGWARKGASFKNHEIQSYSGFYKTCVHSVVIDLAGFRIQILSM